MKGIYREGRDRKDSWNKKKNHLLSTKTNLWINMNLLVYSKRFYTPRKNNADLFLFDSSKDSSVTHFQSTNIAHMSLEVLDLDFDKQT